MQILKWMYSFRIWSLMLGLLLLFSCTPEPESPEIPAEVPMPHVQVHRLDLILHHLAHTPNALKQDSFRHYLDAHVPFIAEWLFAGDTALADSLYPAVLISFCSDPLTVQLLDSVYAQYPPDYPLMQILQKPMQRLQYYFPEEQIPDFYTYVTGFQPNSGLKEQSYLSDHFCGLSLDYFLGDNFIFYPGDIPKYLRRRTRPEYIPVAVMQHFADYLHHEPQIHTSPLLLDYVMAKGMHTLFLEYTLPDVPDSVRMSYSAVQTAFVKAYAPEIYKELIPVLFSSDYMKYEKYINDKPFTPNLSEESADRLAFVLGWSILKQYLERNPKVQLKDLMNSYDYKRIFEEARYKPA
jgi:hypothetical protein